MGILNTMDNEIISSKSLLRGTGISLLDAARLIRNILDALPDNSNTSPIQFCVKVIETGKRHVRTEEMQFAKGFSLYPASQKQICAPILYRIFVISEVA